MEKKTLRQKVVDFFKKPTPKPESHRIEQKEKKPKPIHRIRPSSAKKVFRIPSPSKKELPVAKLPRTEAKKPSLQEKKIEEEKPRVKTSPHTPVAREKIEQLKEKFTETLDLLEKEEIKLFLSEEILRHWLDMGENSYEFDEKFNEAIEAIIKDYGMNFFTPLIQEVHQLGDIHPSSYTAQEVLDTIVDEMG